MNARLIPAFLRFILVLVPFLLVRSFGQDKLQPQDLSLVAKVASIHKNQGDGGIVFVIDVEVANFSGSDYFIGDPATPWFARISEFRVFHGEKSKALLLFARPVKERRNSIYLEGSGTKGLANDTGIERTTLTISPFSYLLEGEDSEFPFATADKISIRGIVCIPYYNVTAPGWKVGRAEFVGTFKFGREGKPEVISLR